MGWATGVVVECEKVHCERETRLTQSHNKSFQSRRARQVAVVTVGNKSQPNPTNAIFAKGIFVSGQGKYGVLNAWVNDAR